MTSGRAADAEVWVDLAGVPVFAGRLYAHRRGRVESASFVYSSDWLADSDAYALDPALPLTAGSHQTPNNQKLFGAFADSCPDRWGRRLIERAEKHRAEVDRRTPMSFGEFDLLLRVRDDLRQGAIRYRRDGVFLDDEDYGVPALTDRDPASAALGPRHMSVTRMDESPWPSSRARRTTATSWRGRKPRWTSPPPPESTCRRTRSSPSRGAASWS